MASPPQPSAPSAAAAAVQPPAGGAHGLPKPPAERPVVIPPVLAEFQKNELAQISNRQLMRWMFAFLRPVKSICILACVYLTASIATEVLTTRQMGNAVDHIQKLHAGSTGTQDFWPWFFGGEGRAFRLGNLWDILLGRDP